MSFDQTRRRSSVDTAAMRDAMCTRIRELGNDILAITRAAVECVEALDATYAEQVQQKQQQQRQQQMRLSPRPSVNVRQTRGFKSVQQIVIGGRVQQRPARQTGQLLSGKGSVDVPVASALLSDSSAVHSRPVKARGTGSGQAGQFTRKRRIARRGSTSSVNVPFPSNSNTTNNIVNSNRAVRAQSSFSNKQHQSADSLTEVITAAAGGVVDPATASPDKLATKSANNSGTLDLHSKQCFEVNDADDSDGEAVHDASCTEIGGNRIVDVCQAAEENYQRMLAYTGSQKVSEGEQRQLTVHRKEEHRSAPLYDLSNAASADPNEKELSKTSQGDNDYAEGYAVGGGRSLSARSFVESTELPADIEEEIAAFSAPLAVEALARTAAVAAGSGGVDATEGQPCFQSTTNYYCVVYIHQSTHVRKQSSGSATGSGYSSSSSVLRRRLTPHLLGFPGCGSPFITERDEDEDVPHMVNSYVSAVYAVGENSRTLQEAGEQHGAKATAVSGSATSAALDTTTAKDARNCKVPKSFKLAEPVVRVELCMPTRRSISSSTPTLSASRASAPSAGAFRFPHIGEPDKDKCEEGKELHEYTMPLEESHGHVEPTTSACVAAAAAAASAESSQGEVAAQIETMEGWRRDRCTSVANRIRRRRTSSLVAPGWQGEYYYYSPAWPLIGPLPTPTSHLAATTTHAEAVAVSNSNSVAEGQSHSAGASLGNNSEASSTAPAAPLVGSGNADHTPPPPHSVTTSNWSTYAHLYSAADDALMDVPTEQLSPPLRPLNPLFPPLSAINASPHSLQQQPHQLSPPRAGSTAAGAFTTYDVLLQTRLSASAASTPRSPRERTAPAAEYSEANSPTNAAAVADIDVTDAEGGRRGTPKPTIPPTSTASTSTTAISVAAAVAAGASTTSSPSRTHRSPQRRPYSGFATAAVTRRRHHPRLEVVVASDYSSMEWAFAGEVRRLSAASEEHTPAHTQGSARTTPAAASGAHTERSTSPAHGSTVNAFSVFATAAPPTPLWAAFKQQALEEEEHRRWDARTREPHGANLHAPILLNVSR